MKAAKPAALASSRYEMYDDDADLPKSLPNSLHALCGLGGIYWKSVFCVASSMLRTKQTG